MGTVWRAEDRLLGRAVALKQVELPTAVPQQERQAMRQRVLREARAAARLSHAGAVTVFDVLEDNEKLFIAMELVKGITLSELVKQHGPLARPQVARIGLRLLEALEVAHASGIVHRDVKPGNVIVTDDGRVKLADFGIASVKGDPQLTATGLVLGSPSYMSPEQARGEAAGPASDLWALGATLYFAVEGYAPFERAGALPTLFAIVNEDPPPPRRAGLLAEPILALLSKDSVRRPGPDALRPMLERAGRADAGNDQETMQIPVGPHPEPASMAATITAKALVGDPSRSEAVSETREVATQPAGEGLETVRHKLRETLATASVPATAKTPPPTRVSRRSPSLYAMGGLALAAIVGVALLLRLQIDGSSAPRLTPPSRLVPPSPRVQSIPTREQPRQARPATPSGWRVYRIPDTGYRIAYPRGWRVIENAVGDGSSVRFQDGAGKYLLVDWTDAPGQDAVAAWRALAAGFSQRHEGYREIRIEPTTFRDFRTAAIWEYSYRAGGTDLHAIDLGFANDKHGFALNFQTPEKDWTSSQELFETFKRTFQGE